MCHHKSNEDRGQERDRFFDTSQVDKHKEYDQADDERHFIGKKVQGQKTEKGVAARDKRDGDGQHIIDKQCTSGHNSGPFAYGMRSYNVAPTAVWKMFDDAGVCVCDDDNGEGGAKAQKDGEISVLTKSPECLFGTV